ncbi:MAG TPA: alanine--tRNA ligase [Thermotogota bacterium]|nr:alanine--tRNA ligase [Thermotogota bacterium]HRW92544.1 alanine--tRNA ligase [Thermotogota bacterium]
MKRMTGNQIRQAFLDFYRAKGHEVLPSASLVPNDPQLLFTVAGMVPFKPIFWGKVSPTYPRVATCQKCVRTNDIEQVGRTPRHHTFFEMLGNFSFGDYFKKETILWAWEFITQVLEMPVEKLWVSIFHEDEEAYQIWTQEVGLDAKRIVRMGKEDNFWGPAGPTGPCGPDSEIFFDMGPNENCPDVENCSPACDCGRFLEFYNLVFTEFNQDEEGNLTPLSRKNIDTGLGLDRLAAILQGVSSNFETDLFVPIIRAAEHVTGLVDSKKEDRVGLRVIADHVRSSVFMVADGVLPSNDGRGYVLKRILRRALRFGWLHGVREPFLYTLVPVVVAVMGAAYPELREKQSFLSEIIRSEEEKFLKTLVQGLELVDRLLEERGKLLGEDVFALYDTFGFPLEVTEEIARERNIFIDKEGFSRLMKQQRERARNARGDRTFLENFEVYEAIGKQLPATVFTGYERLQDRAKALMLVRHGELVDTLREGQSGELISDQTPFYAEKGGQVADTGVIHWDGGQAKVTDVFNPFNELVVHEVEVLEGTLPKEAVLHMEVDAARRQAIARNHSATHLLHEALKRVLGNHVKQAGSMVDDTRLRFDFTHFQSLTPDQLQQVQRLVNEQVLESLPVQTQLMALEDARKQGVVALFDEKYGESVRVVQMNDFSSELCGGTHVRTTGQIGPFRILAESGISSGVRRIEAVTGWNTLQLADRLQRRMLQVADLLKTDPEQMISVMEKVMDSNQLMVKRVLQLEERLANQKLERQLDEVKHVDGIRYLALVQDNLDGEVARNVTTRGVEKLGSGFVVLFNRLGQSVTIVVKVSDDLAGKRVHAGKISGGLSRVLGGGGGGKPDFAQGGGKDPSAINRAIEQIPQLVQQGVSKG